MIGRARRRRRDERGAILVLFAIATPILIGMMAFALDLGYGFVQTRRAQSAADFAAFAAAQQLNGSTVCNGATAPPNMLQLVDIVQHVVSDNAPSIGSAWTGQFIDDTGKPIKGSNFSSASGSAGAFPPPGACGVLVDATPAWSPFFAQIFGIKTLSGNGSSDVSNSIQGQPIGIVALNKVGPHETLGGGSGKFVVSGDMVLNTDVQNQPWSVSSHGWEFNDRGQRQDGQQPVRLRHDPHEQRHVQQGAAVAAGPVLLEPRAGRQGQRGRSGLRLGPDTHQHALVQRQRLAGDGGLQRDQPDRRGHQRPPAVGRLTPSPFNTSIACPGMSAVTYSSSPSSGTLLPGEYTKPVKITGSAQFDDCSGYAGEGAYPGIYRFDQGLWIDPQTSGETVTGSNVLLATNNPYPLAGNVPGSNGSGGFVASGSGNGAPCLPKGTMTSGPSGGGSPEPEVDGSAGSVCSGTSPTTYGVIAYGDSSFTQVSGLYGTGDNLSLIVGGVSGTTVTLSGPRPAAMPAPTGCPAWPCTRTPPPRRTTASTPSRVTPRPSTSPGSSTTPRSPTTGQRPPGLLGRHGRWHPLLRRRDAPDRVRPGWSDGPAPSGGTVTINGTCIVDDFNTDGGTTITIFGQPFSLPGAGRLSFIGWHATAGVVGSPEQIGLCPDRVRARRPDRPGRPLRLDRRLLPVLPELGVAQQRPSAGQQAASIETSLATPTGGKYCESGQPAPIEQTVAKAAVDLPINTATLCASTQTATQLTQSRTSRGRSTSR